MAAPAEMMLPIKNNYAGDLTGLNLSRYHERPRFSRFSRISPANYVARQRAFFGGRI